MALWAMFLQVVPETATGWTQLIRDLGFPAAVAFFVLWRLERRMAELTAAIIELRLTLFGAPRARPLVLVPPDPANPHIP